MKERKEMTELKAVSENWKALERKTAEQRRIAAEYYDTNLIGLIEDVFIENNIDKLTEPVEYLIQSVGTSYEPLVLSIQLLQPKKILFLYTEKSKSILNKVVKYCGLDITDIDMERVDETDPICIYRKIKKAYLEWRRPKKVYVDITGGTKAMSSAAAMAGSMIDVQLIYVGTDEYLVDFRKPEPGSETFYYIANPLEVFGDMEIEKAYALFTENNYAGAGDMLSVLKDKVPDPEIRQQLHFVFLLSKAYEYWDALDFINAGDMMKDLVSQLQRDQKTHRTFILMDMLDVLREQQQILEDMKDIPELSKNKDQMGIFNNRACMCALMFTLYQNALVREKQEKYDMATLLLYRLLEMIEQKRLSNFELNASHMNYDLIDYEKCGHKEVMSMSLPERKNWLSSNLMKAKKELFRRADRVYLSEQVSLLDGYTLLYVLNDPIITEGEQMVGINKLKRIRSMVFLRNNSIFAHGLGPVSKDEFNRFRDFVVMMFREFCLLEEIDFEVMAEKVRWRDPSQSLYYARPEV